VADLQEILKLIVERDSLIEQEPKIIPPPYDSYKGKKILFSLIDQFNEE
jgi:hypothetical protein